MNRTKSEERTDIHSEGDADVEDGHSWAEEEKLLFAEGLKRSKRQVSFVFPNTNLKNTHHMWFKVRYRSDFLVKRDLRLDRNASRVRIQRNFYVTLDRCVGIGFRVQMGIANKNHHYG